MKEILSELYLIFRILLVVSFFEFVAYNIAKKCDKKFLILFFVSLSILLITSLTFVFDNFLLGTNIRSKVYFYFIGSAFIYFIIFTILFAIKKRKYAFTPKEVKKKMVYTYHEKNEYLYVFFKYADILYLTNESSTGIKYKLKKNEFTDDAIRALLKKYNIDYLFDVNRNGIITHKGDKKDDVYYCYMIELKEPYINDEFIEIDVYDIANIELAKLDKYIIIKCLATDDFTDTL